MLKTMNTIWLDEIWLCGCTMIMNVQHMHCAPASMTWMNHSLVVCICITWTHKYKQNSLEFHLFQILVHVHWLISFFQYKLLNIELLEINSRWAFIDWIMANLCYHHDPHLLHIINAQDSLNNLIGQNVIMWGCINWAWVFMARGKEYPHCTCAHRYTSSGLNATNVFIIGHSSVHFLCIFYGTRGYA